MSCFYSAAVYITPTPVIPSTFTREANCSAVIAKCSINIVATTTASYNQFKYIPVHAEDKI